MCGNAFIFKSFQFLKSRKNNHGVVERKATPSEQIEFAMTELAVEVMT